MIKINPLITDNFSDYILKEIKIGKHFIGDKHPVFVIAEAGINHNGSLSLAKKLVDAAKKCGAHCIKFQTHIPESEMIKSDVKLGKNSKMTIWDLFKNCELTENEEKSLKKYCKKKKILFLSTPFSIAAVERLEKIGIQAYKIGSGELTNIPLLKHIAEKNKPVILSTGMSEISEIKKAVRLFKSYKTRLALLQATSTYPTSYEDVNLGVIAKFKKTFGIPVGLSDHSEGIYTALGAIALGACIVEKHFTLDKSMPGPDQKLSIEPSELSELVRGCIAVKKALGESKGIIKEEMPVLRFARESVVSVNEIKKGEKLTENNISTKRPGTGSIPAKNYFTIIGKKAKRNIRKNKQISFSDLY